jgi:hypothetical protein
MKRAGGLYSSGPLVVVGFGSEKLEPELLHLVLQQPVFGGIAGLWVHIVDAKLEHG